METIEKIQYTIDNKPIPSRPPTVHRLKTWPRLFQKIAEGVKTFDIRVDDRDFAVGDIALYEEFDINEGYTGAYVQAEITFILGRHIEELQFVREGTIVMAIKLL